MGLILFIKKRADSFKYAFKGLYWLIKTQGNFQFHIFALCCVTVAGLYFNLTVYEWLAIIICYGLVLMAEGFNSSIEEVINFISPEFNTKAGLIKDVAAAAVLLAAIAAAAVGALIFLPKI